MAKFTPVFENTLKKEGGFQKFAADSANYVDGVLIGTNRGISAQAYKQFYGKTPTEADMKALTQEQAEAIYKKNYWNKIKGDLIENDSVAALMFQFIIGSGVSQLSDLKDIANMVAGRKLFVSNDRDFTDNEAVLINTLDQEAYFNAMKKWRHEYFLAIVKNSIAKLEKQLGRKATEAEINTKTLKQFLLGWQNRLNSYEFEGDKKKSGLST